MVAVIVLMLVSILCIIGLITVTRFTAAGARPEIAAQDPSYAAQLYRSALAVAWDNSPIRLTVLYRVQPPAKLRATISLLRWLYGLLGIFAIGFILAAILLARFAA